MNILFLSANTNFLNKNLYTDLFEAWRDEGHEIYILYCPDPDVYEDSRFNITRAQTSVPAGGLKGLFMQSGPEKAYLNALRLNYSQVKFDLVFYNMDASGLEKVIHQVKILNNAKAYLLTDPHLVQAQVDVLGLKKSTAEYKQIRKDEQALFEVSDKILVFSENMKNYIAARNPEIAEEKFMTIPYGIKTYEIPDIKNEFEHLRIRLRYAMPVNKKSVLLCGEMDEYCGWETIIKFIESHKNNDGILLTVYSWGKGYEKIREYFKDKNQGNLKIKDASPRQDISEMLCACDAGVVFCDSRLSMPKELETVYRFMLSPAPLIACINSASILPECKNIIRSEAGDIFDLNKKLAAELEKTEKQVSGRAEDIDIKKTAQIILPN